MQWVERVAPVAVGLIALLGLGLIDLTSELNRLSRKLQFVVEFQQRWVRYFQALQQGQSAPADYTWLAMRQPRMSSELGSADRIDYRAPFAQYIVSNYPALMNTLAAARSGRGAHPDMVNLVDQLLISRGGVIQDRQESLVPKLSNPVYLVGRGLRLVVSFPLLLLAWSGLLPARGLEGARNSLLFRFVQFLAATILVVAAVVTVVIGWSAFVAQLRSWLPK
jgi:hypothetical protein